MKRGVGARRRVSNRGRFLDILQNDNRMCKIVIYVCVRTAGVAAGGSGVGDRRSKAIRFSAKGPVRARDSATDRADRSR
jgi:hypothetical protein